MSYLAFVYLSQQLKVMQDKSKQRNNFNTEEIDFMLFVSLGKTQCLHCGNTDNYTFHIL